MIKLEEGKFYRVRKGTIIGPMQPRAAGGFYCQGYRFVWSDDGKCHTITQERYTGKDVITEFDLERGRAVPRPDEKADLPQEIYDEVKRPQHYTTHPSGVECIEIAEHFNFCVGNAIKYLWRYDKKHTNVIQDLEKAKWYIEREIKNLRKENVSDTDQD